MSQADEDAERLLGMLHGRDHPLAMADAAYLLGISRRRVEAAILALRLSGEPICSDASGVWLGTPEELAARIERLRARARTQLVTCRALRQTLRRMEGQLVLWRLAG